MFSGRRPRWVLSTIKTIIVSVTVPLLSMMPVFVPDAAQAALAGTGLCQQTVGDNTGVTVTQVGNDCVVKFTSTTASTTWTAPAYLATVRYLVVGGGASGDRGRCGVYWGHGGGGGEVKDSTISISSGTAYTVTVGAGGAATANCTNYPNGNDGKNSVFASVTSIGGYGANANSATGGTSGNSNLGGTGIAADGLYSAGGGGGAGGIGFRRAGGIGVNSNITGSTLMYGAGGAGRSDNGFGTSYSINGDSATASGVTPPVNTGFGGSDDVAGAVSTVGAAGVVVIRYQAVFTSTFSANGASGTPSITTTTNNLGTSFTFPTIGSMSRSGYTFTGWSNSVNGTGTIYAAGSTFYPNADVAYYAVWKSTISYNPTTATSTRAIESTTALTAQAATTLSNGKLVPGLPISSGLVFNMNAADSSSVVGSTWYDYSRNGVSGVMVGSPKYNVSDGSISLNGSTQYINFGSSILTGTGSNNFTASVMFKPDKPAVDDSAVMGRYYYNGSTDGTWIVRQYYSGINAWRQSYGSMNSNAKVNEGDYTYATVTYDAVTTKWSLYLNGVLDISVTTGAANSMTADLVLGATGINTSMNRFWAGRIYSAQGYSRALSAAEVSQNYQALLPNQLVAKANFTLAGYNTAPDGSGTSYGTALGDLSALPTPYARLLPSNFRITGSTTGEWTSPVGNSLIVTTKGTPVLNSTGGKSWGATATFPTLSGGISDGIRLNNPTLTSFTLCAVARYKDVNSAAGSKGRLLASSTLNWFSGYYNASTAQFHHEAWNYSGSTTDTNWHYHCDSGNRAFWDGVKISSWTMQLNTSLPPLAINYDYYAQNSDWEIAEVVIYDQFLSENQIENINRYFKNTYGISAGVTSSSAALITSTTNYASPGGSPALYAQWGSTVTYSSESQTTGSVPGPTLITGTSGTLALNSGNLSRSGYRFDGWNTSPNGTGTNYAAGGTYPNTGNVTLYATWTIPTIFPSGIANADPLTLNPYMRFKASDFDPDAKVWRDSSGNGRNTNLISGSGISLINSTINTKGSTKSFPVVQGTTTDKINFNNPLLSSFTLFNVARYVGTNQQRIIQSNDTNALYGFWQGKSGVAFHYGWITQNTTSVHADNWVLSTDFYSGYRSNGVDRAINSGGDNALRPIGVNVYGAETSDFQIAEVLIFNRQLSLTEIKQVEDYLASTYGISNYTQGFTYPTSKTYYIGAGAGGGGRTETLTATQGLGTKTFTISPPLAGVSLDLSTPNGVAVVVNTVTPVGTYLETITATDQSGATATFQVNLIVTPYTKFDTSTATSVTTTYGKSASLRLNTVQGIGPKVFSIVTNPLNHFTLDTSTAGSGYATLGTTGFIKPGTYSVVVGVSDSTTVRSTYTISFTVNASPLITYPNGSIPIFRTSSLVVHYDITNPLSYSGTETRVADLIGTNYATITSSAPYSSSNGGYLDISGDNYLAMSTCVASIARNSMSYFLWINPRGNGVVILEKDSSWQASTIDIYNGAIQFRVYNGTKITYTLPTLNKWYYVGITYDGTNAVAYVNGIQVGSQATTRSVSTNAVNCLNIGPNIGGSANMGVTSGGNFLFGAMHVYSAPISATDVLNNFEVTQKNYLVSTAKSGSFTINTTAGFAADYSLFTATSGTGNKTFALTPTVTGITLDTSTVNTAILKLGTNIASTNSTTAAVYAETMTATDTVNGVTKYDLSITVNPAISISASTPLTLSTTFGFAAYDTFTASYGTGTKTFSEVSSDYSSAFTISSPSANTAILAVAANLPIGTYTDTITAMDSIGALTNYVLTVIVNPAMTIAGSSSNTLTTTVGKSNTLRVNVLYGTGTKKVTYTSPDPGITVDTTTVGSGYVTLKVETTTPVNTFSLVISVVDSVNASVTGTFSIVVNKWPVIGSPTIVSSNLKVNLDGTVYSGSGSWLDQSGNSKNAVLGASATPVKTNPTYSTNSAGVFSFNETTSATTNYMQIADPGSFETFTVSVWVKFASIPSSGTACIICQSYPVTSQSMNYVLAFNTGKIYGSWFTGSTWSTASSAITPVANTWYNIAYSVYKSGSNYYSDIFSNGTRVGAAVSAGTTAPASSGAPINIGKHYNTDLFINGQVGGVLIYNRALSDAELLQNFNAQGSRFLATNSGTLNYTTTQGVNSTLTAATASDGTGTKTFVMAPTVSGVTIDTSTANSYTLNIASTVAATDSVTARTIFETVTASDALSAATNYAYKFTINPPVQETYTAASITTTSGIAAWDTFTATYGTGNKTFTLTGSPSTSGFTLTQSNNQAVLKVEPTANPGTYYETVTATDEVGATKSLGITVIIKPGPTILGPNTLVAAKDVAYKSPAYVVVNGNAPYTYVLSKKAISPDTNTVTAITFDSATMTINLTNAVGAGTYIDTLTVTDAKGATASLVISLTVKNPISITGSLNITKTYGDLYQQTYLIDNLTTAAGYRTTVGSDTEVCVPILGTVDTYTYEMLTTVGACTWIAPTGVTAVDYAVAAGGGGGGNGRAGGGGGGGVAIGTALPVTAGASYAATIGAGGTAGIGVVRGGQGGNSTFASANNVTTYLSAGGGGGGGAMSTDNAVLDGAAGNDAPTATIKRAGGAGGGGGTNTNRFTIGYYSTGGASGAGTVTAFKGGNSFRCDSDINKADGNTAGSGRTNGGGGGANGEGAGYVSGQTCPTYDANKKPNGGAAASTTMTGTTVYLGGGGGGSDGRGAGGQEYTYYSTGRGLGNNGGGDGEQADVPTSGTNATLIQSAAPATSGAHNSGGGGGGGINSAGAGGSGLIIVKYPTQTRITNAVSLTAVSNGSATSSGSVLLTVPENVQAGSTSKVLKLTNGGTTTSYTINITINKAVPTVTIALPGNVTTGKYGTAVTVYASVSTDGTVEFKDAGTVITGCSAVSTSSGIASCTWTPSVVGSRTITAKLTPTDVTNYDSSTATSAFTIGKADTLTVTAGNESALYNNGSAITLAKPFTYSGLASIDTLTAVGMIYTGTANDLTSVNTKTGPTLAGSFVITPDTTTAGISTISSNYAGVSVVPGTLTVNRIAPTLALVYATTNIVTYAPNLTVDTSTATRSGNGTKSFISSSLDYCAVDSSTARISVIKAGSCYITMNVAQSANFLAGSILDTVTVNKATRTITLSAPVSTLKFTDTTTVSSTVSGGTSDGTITYSLNATPGCTIDPLNGLLTAISGTLACTLNATISTGDNYESATTTNPLALTIAKANAPVITISPVTAVNHTPGLRAAITPVYSVAGLKGTDSLNALALTYGFVSNPFETFSYSDTRTPIDAGTYSITPSAITLKSGLVSNYETPLYASSVINFTINRIAQDTVTITNVNAEITVPYYLNITGGNNLGGAVTYNKLSGACTLTTNRLDASTPGLCVVSVTLAGTRNYLPATSDSVTVMIRNYTVTQIFTSGGNTGIEIKHQTSLSGGDTACTSGCAPTITRATPDAGRAGDVIVLTGTQFSNLLRVIFNVFYDATIFNADSLTQITVEIPAGVSPTDLDGIEVVTSGGTSMRFYDFTILP